MTYPTIKLAGGLLVAAMIYEAAHFERYPWTVHDHEDTPQVSAPAYFTAVPTGASFLTPSGHEPPVTTRWL